MFGDVALHGPEVRAASDAAQAGLNRASAAFVWPQTLQTAMAPLYDDRWVSASPFPVSVVGEGNKPHLNVTMRLAVLPF